MSISYLPNIPVIEWEFEKQLGQTNDHEIPPVAHDTAGNCFVTMGGVIVLFPDHWLGYYTDLEPVAPGTEVILMGKRTKMTTK